MHRFLVAPALVLALFMVGCEDDSSSAGQSVAALSGELFTQTAHSGSLTPVEGQEDVFTLTLDDPAPNVTAFTDRPIRRASTEPLGDFVDSWAGRGFEDDPPNAALVLDQAPDDADTAVYTLADPNYDASSGSISYTATRIEGGTAGVPLDEGAEHPAKFGDAHLFIDPSSSAIHNVVISLSGNKLGAVRLAIDPPWSVVLGTGGGISGQFGGGPGEFVFSAQSADIRTPGGAEFTVSGGSGPITGTAEISRGASVTAQVDNGPEQPIKSGSFSIGGG